MPRDWDADLWNLGISVWRMLNRKQRLYESSYINDIAFNNKIGKHRARV